MSNHNYVMATDEDFKGLDGHLRYIGKEPYIEIPHIIQGENITDINWMFYKNKVIKGIKSTNKKIKSVESAFYMSYTNELDLSEFDATQVSSLSHTFNNAKIKTIIFPNTGFPKIETASCAFYSLKTDTLNLSGFDFSNSNCYKTICDLKTRKIIFPTKGLAAILKSNPIEIYYPLEYVPASSQTEETCWTAVTDNKIQGIYAKVKSKKILMYLGAKCPEYAKFYYDEEE